MRVVANAAFDRCIGNYYSGAETPTSGVKGLSVYMADRGIAARRGEAPAEPRKY
jgi:hypothetical protein